MIESILSKRLFRGYTFIPDKRLNNINRILQLIHKQINKNTSVPDRYNGSDQSLLGKPTRRVSQTNIRTRWWGTVITLKYCLQRLDRIL